MKLHKSGNQAKSSKTYKQSISDANTNYAGRKE